MRPSRLRFPRPPPHARRAGGGASLLIIGALLVVRAGSAWPHSAQQAASGTGDAWDALVIACLAASGIAYARGLGNLWRAADLGRGIPAPAIAAFVAGWSVLALALLSPLDALSGKLFAAHMVQHELLMLVAAPLLVLGRPLAVWAWALRPSLRRAVVTAVKRPLAAASWRVLTAPVAAWGLHALALWCWHIPSWFDAASISPGWHAAQHGSFLFSALLFWWACLPRAGVRLGPGLFSLFTTMIHTGALGALLALAQAPWYAAYAQAGGALGLTPLEDQQLGGLIMWVPAALAYLGAALVLVSRALALPAQPLAGRTRA